MSNDKIQIEDVLTGEVTVREMTNEEQAQRDAQIAVCLANKQAKAQAEAEAKAVKIRAYEKLGLTAEEIEALIPSPQPIESKP